MSDIRPQSSTSIVERLRFDAARCELHFSKGVASNIEEGIAEIERLRALLEECRPYVANASHWDVGLIANIDAALAGEEKP